MNRRDFLAGSVALAGQQGLLRPMSALSIAGQDAPPATSPQNLLSSTFTEVFLSSKLLTVDEWHPFPRWSERGGWEGVPADIRARIIAQAEEDQKGGWNALLASSFLEFKRNGNRSRYEAQSFGRRGARFLLV